MLLWVFLMIVVESSTPQNSNCSNYKSPILKVQGFKVRPSGDFRGRLFLAWMVIVGFDKGLTGSCGFYDQWIGRRQEWGYKFSSYC